MNAVDCYTCGPLRTALILFQIWLLGRVLAEQSDNLTPAESSSIGLWTMLSFLGCPVFSSSRRNVHRIEWREGFAS